MTPAKAQRDRQIDGQTDVQWTKSSICLAGATKKAINKKEVLSVLY